jgi:hypothetical protein
VEKENRLDLGSIKPFERFSKRIEKHRSDLQKLVQRIKASGKVVFGYGASTKGNVVLQYCGFSAENIPYIAEVNQDKFGSFTPVTLIPIISEQKARELNPDYFLVLPWHFRENILKKERNFHKSKSHYIFPLPKIEIV